MEQFILSPDEVAQSNLNDGLDIWLVIGGSLWLAGVSVSLHVITWLTEEVLLNAGITFSTWIWFTLALIQGALVGIPAYVLWKVRSSERYRPIYLTWTLGSLFIIVLSPVRLVRPPSTQLAALLQIVCTSLFLALLLLFLKRRSSSKLSKRYLTVSGIALAAGAAALMVYPWFVWEALGSLLDTLLGLIAAFVFGVTAGYLLAYFLFIPIRITSKGIGRDLLLGGFAAGIMLLLMASAFGAQGLQVILMLFLPALGIAVFGVCLYGQKEQAGVSWAAGAVLVGLTTAASTIFVDSDELVLSLAFGPRDVPYWTRSAVLVSIFIALLLSLLTLIARHRLTGAKPAAITGAVAAGAWIVGLFLYFAAGQPGFFGDQIFVIMADQAQLSDLDSQFVSEDRAEFVYHALVDHADKSQGSLRKTLDDLGFEYTPYYLVNSIAVDAGPVVGKWLALREDVDRVLSNPILRPLPAVPRPESGTSEPPESPEWNIRMIGADQVWDKFGVSGENIVVGLADSGAQYDHPALAASYRGWQDSHDYNWYDPWFGTEYPTDSIGHGTHTLGTIIGAGTGAAPGAQWIACADLSRNLANPALYLDCLQFLFAPFPMGGDPFVDGVPEKGANIINNSWLCPEIEGCDSQTLIEAAKNLRQAGIFVTSAAGNEGPRCQSIIYPLASFDEVFSVGAVDEEGELALFSSIGPVSSHGKSNLKPDLAAPGVAVLSTFPNNTYSVQSGTSMAAPHVAGVVALMWSANPELIGDIDATEAILKGTARPYVGSLPACPDMDETPNNAVGYGILDAFAATEAAVAMVAERG